MAITALQDVCIWEPNLGGDVALKSICIVIVRLGILLIFIRAHMSATTLLFAFVVSQCVPAVLWLVVRGPVAFAGTHIFTAEAAQREQSGQPWDSATCTLPPWLYPLTGVPAVVTARASPDSAGRFYVAWTAASVLASLAIAVANSIVAVSWGEQQGTQPT